jgi:hypothetical protein
MRCSVIACVVVFSCTSALPKEQRSTPATPSQFEIGRETHFDFGPPFVFYELFIVRSKADGSSVERILLTPAGHKCLAPAKLEAASGTISEPVAAILGSKNPCTIPEKALQHELKRGRHKLVFSFASVVMQVDCGSKTRLLRSRILDRDMFDAAANTPGYTSWTMRLLGRLDRAVGPGVMEKPVFPTVAEEETSSKVSDSQTLRDLAAGKYDALFQGGNFRLSDLYQDTQKRPAPASVRLVSSVPIQPEVYLQPEYPPLAKLARVEGAVSFIIEIDTKGAANNLAFQSGHPLLRAAVKRAVASWKFPADMITYKVWATIEFALNCAE